MLRATDERRRTVEAVEVNMHDNPARNFHQMTSDTEGPAWALLATALRRDVPTSEQVAPDLEKAMLEAFAVQHQKQYDFTKGPAQDLYAVIFDGLLNNRMCSAVVWGTRMTSEHRYLVVICVRELSRDAHFLHRLVTGPGLLAMGRHAAALTRAYAAMHEDAHAVPTLVEVAAVARHVAAVPQYADRLRAAALLPPLLSLLTSMDAVLLPQVLLSLEGFAAQPAFLGDVFSSDAVEALLQMLVTYTPEQQLPVLRLLLVGAHSATPRRALLDSGAATALVTFVAAASGARLAHALKLLRKLISDKDAAREVMRAEGIPVLVELLRRVPQRQGVTPEQAAILQLVCSILRVASENADAAHQIRCANGVYLLGQLLLIPVARMDSAHEVALRAGVLRALRYVYAVERNRTVFKRLFTPDTYALFIDVGHYQSDITWYEPVWGRIAALTEAQRGALAGALEDINCSRGSATRQVKDYVLLELLGKGAFGSVFKARHAVTGHLVALKELPMKQVTMFGGTDAEGADGLGRVAQEVSILSSLSHPNVVRYHHSFTCDDHLYIAMELVEGESLADHLVTLAQRKQRLPHACMPEAEIWSILTQLLQGLHYIHDSKGVVHRDLTPSNLVLGRSPHGLPVVKLADFGLAKQQTDNNVMQSMVGTMTYTCPEIVTNRPYNEKADVWSLGCILYHMLMARPPFDASNPFTLAAQIVEGAYAPVADPPSPAPPYTAALKNLVPRLLTHDCAARPTVAAIASLVAPVLLDRLDAAAILTQKLALSLDLREKQRVDAALQRSKHEAALRKLRQAVSTGGAPDHSRALPPSPNGSAILHLSHEGDAGGSTPPCIKGLPVSGITNHTVKVSSSRLRLIADPCARLLTQLHKLEWLSQLPPSAAAGVKRRQVERFRRHLFGLGTSAGYVKSELAKLMAASPEPLDSESSKAAAHGDALTYQKLSSWVEELLTEYNYYAGITST